MMIKVIIVPILRRSRDSKKRDQTLVVFREKIEI